MTTVVAMSALMSSKQRFGPNTGMLSANNTQQEAQVDSLHNELNLHMLECVLSQNQSQSK